MSQLRQLQIDTVEKFPYSGLDYPQPCYQEIKLLNSVVFANLNREDIRTLSRRCHITVMDSTHKYIRLN
jgi:hypothetical protein